MKRLWLLLSLFVCFDAFTFVNLRRQRRVPVDPQPTTLQVVLADGRTFLFNHVTKEVFEGYIDAEGNAVLDDGQASLANAEQYRAYASQYPRLAQKDFAYAFTMPDGRVFRYDPSSELVSPHVYNTQGYITEFNREAGPARITDEQRRAYLQNGNLFYSFISLP